jgi:hypothetical protein
LLRKAKERGGVLNAQQYKNLKEREKKREDPAPPVPSFDRPSTASSSSGQGRQRSSTSAGPSQPISNSSSVKDGKNGKNRDEWMQTSPRPKETGTLKVSVNSIFKANKFSTELVISHLEVLCVLFGEK